MSETRCCKQESQYYPQIKAELFYSALAFDDVGISGVRILHHPSPSSHWLEVRYPCLGFTASYAASELNNLSHRFCIGALLPLNRNFGAHWKRRRSLEDLSSGSKSHKVSYSVIIRRNHKEVRLPRPNLRLPFDTSKTLSDIKCWEERTPIKSLWGQRNTISVFWVVLWPEPCPFRQIFNISRRLTVGTGQANLWHKSGSAMLNIKWAIVVCRALLEAWIRRCWHF